MKYLEEQIDHALVVVAVADAAAADVAAAVVVVVVDDCSLLRLECSAVHQCWCC